jgi:hypothetical protein
LALSGTTLTRKQCRKLPHFSDRLSTMEDRFLARNKMDALQKVWDNLGKKGSEKDIKESRTDF